MRERLRADVQAGLDQLARGQGKVHDKASGRRLIERIKADGRAARIEALMRYRLSALAEQDLLEIWLYVAADASVEEG